MGEIIDRDIRFVLLAEGNARQALPALARLRRKIVYMGGEEVSEARVPSIETVLERSPFRSEIEVRSVGRLFPDFMREGSEATFVFPVRVGLLEHYRSYAEDPLYQAYLKTPLGQLPNRIVILNEVFLHRVLLDPNPEREAGHPSYQIPHVHRILCRSGAELRHCQGVYRRQVDVSGAGDMFLDEASWPRSYQKETRTVAFLTSTHRIDASATIARMLDDLSALRFSGSLIERLILKEHPGTEDVAYRESIRRRCREMSVEFQVWPGHGDLSDLSERADIALVQDSMTSHLVLRRHGIESFFYPTGEGLGMDREFLRLSSHPECRLGDALEGRYSADDYDAWVRDTFMLDGHCVDRFLQAVD